MWRKKNDDGAMGTRSLIRQNMKELRMQGIDLNKFESQEHLLYPPLAKDVKLKDLGTELDSKIINESYSLRDRQRRSMHYILFSKPVFKQIDTSDWLESDDLKKKLCLTILPKLLPNHVPAELVKIIFIISLDRKRGREKGKISTCWEKAK